ncbi:MAG: FAD-dependent oxidoreductase [Deinococcota bacterium]
MTERLHQGWKQHHVIVGAGIAGSSLAYALSKHANVRVTLIERGHIAQQGASSVPLALLNPHRGRSGRASDKDLAGLTAMHTLANDLTNQGLDHGISLTGVLRIASTPRQASKWRKLTGVTWLDHEQLPSSYHCPFGGFLVPSGGWLKSHKLLRALVDASKQRGTTVLERHHVADVVPTSTGKWQVMTEHEGEVGMLEADVVHLCIGADTYLPDYLPEEITERLEGDVIGLANNIAMPYPIAGAVYGAKDDTTVYIGGNHRDQGEPDPDAPLRLRKSASWFVPGLATAKVSSVWTGVRAKQASGQPLIQELAANLWFMGAFAGRGFLCALAEANTWVKTHLL